MSNLTKKLPTFTELIEDSELSLKENAFTVLCNQSPPDEWLSEHPMIKEYKYLSIQRVEYLMSRIFGKFTVVVKDTKILANSVCVTVSVTVTNPITLEKETQDGVGACPIQTDKGAGAMDWNAAKADGVMKALPAAESYAFKDACEKWGKLFGKDLGRKDSIGYDPLLKEATQYDWDILRGLWSDKMDMMDTPTIESIDLVIVQKDKTNYTKTLKYLQSL